MTVRVPGRSQRLFPTRCGRRIGSTLHRPSSLGTLLVMADNEYHWVPRAPNLPERVGAGVYVALLAVLACSYFCRWSLFGGYEKQIGAVLVMVGLVLLRFMPTVRRD
jgi:hypothetical protein